MNRTPVAVAISSAAFTILFFEENAGLNFLLFNFLVVGLFYYVKPVLRNDRKFLFGSLLTCFSAFFILVYGSDLAVFANVISLLVLCASAVTPEASLINNLLQGISSIVTASIRSIMEFFTEKNRNEQKPKCQLSTVITYLVPLFLGLIFLAIYRRANPLFERYTEKLNLDFISIHWVLFALGGIVVCCGLFLLKRQSALDQLESELDAATDTARASAVWNQNTAFIVLMILLNAMVLFINGLDVNYLYRGAGLPEGITHKQFVHNGVGNLILSIILGITTLIYFLQRVERTSLIKTLVYLWIGQNFLIVLSTAMRNNMYIQEALLTYLRIGVYYWLFMAAAGLTTTIIKIRQRKNTWYLFRVNTMIAWVVLVLSAAVDWDYLISVYNVKNLDTVSSLDKRYMLSISEGNLALLYSLRDEPGFNTDSV